MIGCCFFQLLFLIFVIIGLLAVNSAIVGISGKAQTIQTVVECSGASWKLLKHPNKGSTLLLNTGQGAHQVFANNFQVVAFGGCGEQGGVYVLFVGNQGMKAVRFSVIENPQPFFESPLIEIQTPSK